MAAIHLRQPRALTAKQVLMAAGVACGLVCSAVSAAAASEIDIVRLQASYDNGNQRVHDAALEAHLAQIVKRIKDANPELANLTVTVHVLRETLPYAFCLDNGAMYVSTGLIARLANETQLAGLITAQFAGIVRRDDQALHRTLRQRALAEFIPDLLIITATMGAVGGALNKARSTAQEAGQLKLQSASDAAALQWLKQAGYDPREVPRGAQTLLDELTREQRFGGADLSRADKLAARIDSFTKGLPPEDVTSGQGTTATADWWRPTARQFALDIILDDLNNGRSVALQALLDSLDATDGPGGVTAFLRAQELQRREPGPEHAAEVIAAYERCIAYSDAPFVAFRELGFVYRREVDAARARTNFQRYLTIAPKAPDAPIIRGYLEGL
jgi:hypothetical protein